MTPRSMRFFLSDDLLAGTDSPLITRIL